MKGTDELFVTPFASLFLSLLFLSPLLSPSPILPLSVSLSSIISLSLCLPFPHLLSVSLPPSLSLLQEQYFKMKGTDELFGKLEEHQMALSHLKSGPYFMVFSERINKWVGELNEIAETIEMMNSVQK